MPRRESPALDADAIADITMEYVDDPP